MALGASLEAESMDLSTVYAYIYSINNVNIDTIVFPISFNIINCIKPWERQGNLSKIKYGITADENSLLKGS